MLRYSIVLLAGLWMAGPAAAGTWADGMFDELSKDFGPVPRGPALTHNFRFVNTTKSSISISNVRVSCGCTTAHALNTHLAPGEVSAIAVQMDTTRFRGIKSVTIFVQFNRPSFEEVRLWVQANGRDDFTLTPDTLAYGQVKRSTAPVLTVSLTYHGNPAFAITDLRTDSNYVKATSRLVRRSATDVVYEVASVLREDAPVGKWYSDVWLGTNDPNMPQIRVPLTVEIESALSISPDAVGLGNIKVNETSGRRVIVRGVKPFKITDIKGTDPELSVQDSSPGPRQVHVLTVKYKPSGMGDLHRNVRVITDLKQENEVSFEVSARVTR